MHDFCGRTHAALYAEMHDENLAPPHGICHVCKLAGCEELVHFEEDTRRVHDFCCKAHADQAIAAGQHPPSLRATQYGRHIDASRQCALPGCTALKFVDPDTHVTYDYCGRTHARRAAARGTEAHPSSLGEAAHYSVTFTGRPCQRGCATCSGNLCQACDPQYTLSQLTTAHPKLERIKAQFVDSWAPDVGAAPNVLRVYQIRNPQAVFDRYEGYKAALQAQGRPVNEVRRFHATGMQCNFGVTQSQRPCDESSCAVCSIAASAFKLAYAGGGGLTPAFGFLRYGRGLYFSRTASKSHTYGAESERTRAGRKYRVMVWRHAPPPWTMDPGPCPLASAGPLRLCWPNRMLSVRPSLPPPPPCYRRASATPPPTTLTLGCGRSFSARSLSGTLCAPLPIGSTSGRLMARLSRAPMAAGSIRSLGSRRQTAESSTTRRMSSTTRRRQSHRTSLSISCDLCIPVGELKFKVEFKLSSSE